VGVPSLCENDRFRGYREAVLNHLRAALEPYATFQIVISSPNGIPGIEGIAKAQNELVDRALAGFWDYLWIVQADVEVPPDAFEKLLGLDVDVAQGVVPGHDDKNRLVCGFLDENKKVWYLPRSVVQGQVLSGWVFAGLSCTLIKRRVLEAGIRFRYVPSVGEDILFMYDVQVRGFVAKVHGGVMCGHLPEWSLGSVLAVAAPSFNILDVGCGHRPKGDINVDLHPGATAHRAADQRVNDDVALHVHEIPNFLVADGANLPFRDGAFQKVYSWHLIEHLPDPGLFLAECCRVAAEQIEVRCPNGDPKRAYGLAAYGETKPLHRHRLTREWFDSKLKNCPGWDWTVHFDHNQGEPWEIVVEGWRKELA
jgi:SAM-dependent methyltransferase